MFDYCKKNIIHPLFGPKHKSVPIRKLQTILYRRQTVTFVFEPFTMEDSMRGVNTSCCYGIFDCCSDWLVMSTSKSIKIKVRPVRDNNTPLTTVVPGTLDINSVILVTGKVKRHCLRFAIDFVCDKEDIALHVNPRFNQRQIVVNHCVKNHWGPETVVALGKYNLHRQSEFTVYICLCEDKYLISINNLHLCEFPFKLSHKRVQTIELNGEVEMVNVSFQTTKVYPALKTPVPTLPLNLLTESDYELPYVCKLENGFKNGFQIDIKGVVKMLPHSFTINLQNGPQIWPHPTIGLHLNPRFTAAKGMVFIVRNSWSNGHWGNEERAPGFQFMPGRPFNLAIQCEMDQYSLWVDGQLIASFRFRLPPEDFEYLFIDGDIFLNSLKHSDTIDKLYTKLDYSIQESYSERFDD